MRGAKFVVLLLSLSSMVSTPQSSKTAPAVFTDITASAGIVWKQVSGASVNHYLPETMGGGVALLDFDRDGLLDIFLVTVVMGDIWKLILNAPRPGRPGVPDHGFPSGHTMTAFAISFLVTEIDLRAGAVWYLLAAAVGWSRVEGVAHYPYQVLCGAPMGVAMAWAVTHLAQGVFFPRLPDMWRRRRRVTTTHETPPASNR